MSPVSENMQDKKNETPLFKKQFVVLCPSLDIQMLIIVSCMTLKTNHEP